MVGESNRNVFLIQKDSSNFAEFEISEFEISRVDCFGKELPADDNLSEVQKLDLAISIYSIFLFLVRVPIYRSIVRCIPLNFN